MFWSENIIIAPFSMLVYKKKKTNTFCHFFFQSFVYLYTFQPLIISNKQYSQKLFLQNLLFSKKPGICQIDIEIKIRQTKLKKDVK